MLNSVFRDAIARREKTLEILKGPRFDRIRERARGNWIEHAPSKADARVIGIDSSFNSTKFQGADLWAVTAVSIRPDGEVISDLHELGLGTPPKDLSSMASGMEIEACSRAVDAADLVLMDGSLHSMMLRSPNNKRLLEMLNRHGNVVFVSKTSGAKTDFADLGQVAGDIFYYNHATASPGFSRPTVDPKHGEKCVITSTYARLGESLPSIKIELLGGRHPDGAIRTLLDKIYKNSVGGYPYSLKLAHNNCKISGRDLAKLVSLHGLSGEIGSREVLG